MAVTPPQNIIRQLLDIAGVTIDGSNPWDIQVHNPKFYQRIKTHFSLGLGEAYMEGWWDCPALDQFFERICRASLESYVLKNWRFFSGALLRALWVSGKMVMNYQTKPRALEVGERHYDIGNDLYEKMLDKRMNYSCGYWKDVFNLDEAQEAKLELICQKLQLQPGMKVLDIGCGWGGFAKYAAEKYKVSVVGTTISRQQQTLAQKLCEGLPVEIRFQDYRDINEQYDRISSVGMFEHVGYKNYRTYMKVAHRCLKNDGLFLLHTIGNNYSLISTDPWINKYIFPNGNVPSIKQIGKAIEKLFVMEDWHSFGAYYDQTLMAWHENFNKYWDTLKNNYDERFFRMWNYYLLSCAGAFRARDIQLWQIVLSKKGIVGGYTSVR